MKTQFSMRKTALAALIAAIFAVGLPGVAAAQVDPLAGHSTAAVIPDPVQGQGADFRPADATATEAYMGPPRLERDT